MTRQPGGRGDALLLAALLLIGLATVLTLTLTATSPGGTP